MLGAALQLSAACALVANALYQLRRLARIQAALASAEVRLFGGCRQVWQWRPRKPGVDSFVT